MAEENLEPPGIDLKHKAKLIVKGGLGGVPFAGGLLGEGFDLIYKSGYEKKLQKWRESITIKLIQIDNEKTIDNLVGNEEFHSLLVETSLIALKNHQQIKLDAISNLLISSTISPIDYDFKKLFVNYIDQFTTYHLRTMGMIIENERQKVSKNRLVFDQLHRKILKEVFYGESELKDQIFEELQIIKGLISKIKTNTEVYNVATFVILTKLGEKFAELVYPN